MTDDLNQTVSDDNAVIRGLREKADEADTLRRELEALKAEKAEADRRNALNASIDSLGIPADRKDKFAKLAEKFIEGDPTTEALRSLADEYGFAPAPDPMQQHAQAQAQAAQLHQGGGVTVPLMGPNGHAAAELTDLRDRLYAGDTTVTQQMVDAAIAANIGFGGSPAEPATQ